MESTQHNTQSKTLVLVEDDLELASLISDYLSHHEFIVHLIHDGLSAVDFIINMQPDIVILDIMLPGQSGMDVCRQIRTHYQGVILMQTALDDDIDQMMGLELGADDYVIKQVQPRLLLSRIRALLRRSQPLPASQKTQPIEEHIKLGRLDIDITRRRVCLNQQEIILTTAEFELLHLLGSSPGQVVSRDSIMQKIRGFEYDGLDRSIDRRISRLRKKLICNITQQALIKTVRGKGYQLCMPLIDND
jgi:DNA-binding response OmpR family regulator